MGLKNGKYPDLPCPASGVGFWLKSEFNSILRSAVIGYFILSSILFRSVGAYKSADFIISPDGFSLHMAALTVRPEAKFAAISRHSNIVE